ncbi:Topless-related protein 1 [Camellia lanceoleosa]|uniref:Topless-related protein 1 n=1 Tax=Camellia lanceoleosa TaxID=1840588 RepID=A0ACC0FFZ6_9ERIC|nr:Topless-related protein 1 [Camellia lanceoleosa]
MNSDQETGDIMSGIDREKLSLVLQSLTEMNFRKTHRVLESESGVFIDIKYVEELVANKKWDEVTRYVSGFTKWDDNHHSTTINFIFWSWKYFEALDKCNLHKATDILTNKLKVFSESNEELMKEMTLILKCHLRLANREIQRKNLKGTLFKKCLKELPIIHFPTLAYSKLKHLFLQGNPNNSEAGLASQSANLAPEGQIEVCDPKSLILYLLVVFVQRFEWTASTFCFSRLTIVKPVPDPLSRQLKNLRTINQDPPCLSRIRRETVTKLDFFLQPKSVIRCGVFTTKICKPILLAYQSKDVRKNVNPRLDEVRRSKRMRLNALTQPNQIRSITVSEPPETNMIIRLIYTNSGMGLLVLASNGIKILWKLLKDDTNPDNKATTTMYTLQLWEPGAGKQMKNDFPGINCFALTNNDSFLMLASGGSMTLFDTTGSETTKVFMCPACKATCLLFPPSRQQYPQERRQIALGFSDGRVIVIELPESLAQQQVVPPIVEERKHSFNIFLLFFSVLQKQERAILMSSYQETGDIMSGMIREKLLAVFKYLTEKNFQKARHEFECESGLFFDINYFEELVVNGDWDEADRYLSCFTKWDDNRHSMKMFFEIKKQKYFEALDKCNFHEAADILTNELKVFSESDQELTKEMTDLLKIKGHANMEIQRKNLMGMLFNKLLINHPIISEKLQFPTLADSTPNYSDASLALQSAHLVPVGQIEVGQGEPLQTIARPVPDPLSLPQNNLPTINQQGGAPLASINNFCDISNTHLSGISNTRILPAPGEYGSSHRLFDANAGITTSVGTINQDTPTLSRIRPETVTKDMRNNVNPRLDEVPPNKRMRLNVLSRPNQIRSLIVSEPPETDKITRLIYTNSGMALLALSSNGIQMFRKLPKSDTNPDSKAKTVHPLPSLWKPRAGKQMVNDFPSIDCFALSSDENFLMLASGGSMALFDTTGCETKGFSCPATATCLLFHPEDNNVIIVGMDDSTIQIFNVHLSKRRLPLDLSKMIVHATFSCNSQLVYIAIKNGTVAISHAYPIVIAAHPQKCNQIALGFSDGRVIVIELPESTAQQQVAPSPVKSESTRSKTHTAQQMMMLPAPGEAGSSRPSFDANVKITSGGLALQSSHLVPAGCQIEPRQTIARPVPDPLSLQQRNLPTINQQGGSSFTRINKRGRFEVLRYPNQVRSLTVSEPLKTNTIMRLIYTNSGTGLLALDSNDTNLLWKWRKDDVDIKATTMYPPQLWEPEARKKMKNDLPDIEPKDPINCFALSNNDNFLMSATGGAVTLFNTKDSKKLADFMRPPPAATCLLFHPVDNNVIIAGMEDATIQIYYIRLDEVKFKIVGHSRRITGLAFSTKLNVLVSSAADAEIVVWKYIDDEKWIQKKKINVLQFERGGRRAPKSRLLDTQVQFHQDQNHFLAVNERRVAIFNTTEPESKNSDKCPLAIAAHPQERSQFALGYTDGSVIVIEIPESIAQQKIVLPPVENESTRSKTPTAQQIVGSVSDKRPSA